MPEKTVKEILEDLYVIGWRDHEYPQCTPITMQQIAVNKALKDIQALLPPKIKINNKYIRRYPRSSGWNAYRDKVIETLK